MDTTKHEANCASFKQLEEKIIQIDWKPIVLKLEDIHKMIQQIKTVYGNGPYFFLMNIKQFKGAPKEVRDYFTSPEFVQIAKGMAMVSGSALSRIVGNLFLSFNKPAYSCKMFSDIEKAFLWLKKKQ